MYIAAKGEHKMPTLHKFELIRMITEIRLRVYFGLTLAEKDFASS